MASSTPATSFSSDDSKHRGRPTKRKAQMAQTPYALPSPKRSDAGSDVDRDAHDTSEKADAAVVEQAYRAIWDSFCGRLVRSTVKFPLQYQQSYDELYQKLEEHRVPGLLAYFQGFGHPHHLDLPGLAGLPCLRLRAVSSDTKVRESISSKAKPLPALHAWHGAQR
ncbi:hypothetical protein J7T55_010044 [Diaporthe amygdali]|uniref:uncharacterized protein n=1 Tax=Phomopsis amygdali TaxID=1214568 RepID=UPI0022FED58D|nr:uncharacterized protein J7T55_010044 [Diaporthe amygdali]KAJ0103717.1 hypothetical protein J7T55_010044 [Diaporthe amygdali]